MALAPPATTPGSPPGYRALTHRLLAAQRIVTSLAPLATSRAVEVAVEVGEL